MFGVLLGVMTLIGLPVAAAPPATPDGAVGPRVNLAIDTSLLDPGVAARLEPEISRQLEPVLEQANLHMVSPPEVGEQNLNIRVTAFDEKQRSYDVDLQLSSEGGDTTLITVTCEACNERRLIAKLVEEIPRLVELHEQKYQDDGSAIPIDEPGVDRPVPDVPKHVVDSPELGFKRMSALGGVGLGTAMLGVGGLVAGGVQLGLGEVYEDPAQTPPVWTVTDHRPLGRALLGVGAVALAGGVTMLAVDLIRMNKRRAGRSTGAVYPLWDAHGAGLGYSLRF